MECQRTSVPLCDDDGHTVKSPKGALRRGLETLVPRCNQHLEGLQEGLRGMRDGTAVVNVMDVLQMIEGRAATCRLSVTPSDGVRGVSIQWDADGKVDSKFDLLKTTVVAAMVGGGSRIHCLPQTADPSGVKRRRIGKC